MQKKTRNALLFFGIILSLALVALRVEGSFGLSGGLGMFSSMLGYEGDKHYALILLDPQYEPLLFLLTASDGAIAFESVASADSLLTNLPPTDFPAAAENLIGRIATSGVLTNVDAVGVMTSSAAAEIADAYGGLYLGGKQINSLNFNVVVWEAALSQHAAAEFSDKGSFSKRKLITRSRLLLLATKDVFSKKTAVVYFRGDAPFGKSCFGACKTELFEYFASGASLNR